MKLFNVYVFEKKKSWHIWSIALKMLNIEVKFVKVGSEKNIKTPFIWFNEYLIYLMFVNKNKVFQTAPM